MVLWEALAIQQLRKEYHMQQQGIHHANSSHHSYSHLSGVDRRISNSTAIIQGQLVPQWSMLAYMDNPVGPKMKFIPASPPQSPGSPHTHHTNLYTEESATTLNEEFAHYGKEPFKYKVLFLIGMYLVGAILISYVVKFGNKQPAGGGPAV